MKRKVEVVCTIRENGDSGPIKGLGLKERETKTTPNSESKVTRFTIPNENAIKAINDGLMNFFVKATKKVNGKDVIIEADVVVREDEGKEYLTTDPDRTTENNLLSLPIC